MQQRREELPEMKHLSRKIHIGNDHHNRRHAVARRILTIKLGDKDFDGETAALLLPLAHRSEQQVKMERRIKDGMKEN